MVRYKKGVRFSIRPLTDSSSAPALAGYNIYNMVCLLRVCVLLFMVVSCSAECYIRKPQVDLLSPEDIINHLQGCVDSEGVTHDFNSEWQNDCYNCLCTQSGIQCCNKIPTAIEHPDECEMVVDKTTCSFTLVLVSDHSKPCELA